MISWRSHAVVAYTPPLDAPPPPHPPDRMWSATGDDGALLEAFGWTPPAPQASALRSRAPGPALLELRRHPEPGCMAELEPWPPHAPRLEEIQALVDTFPAKDSGRVSPIYGLHFLSNGPDADYPEPRGFYVLRLQLVGAAAPVPAELPEVRT